MRVYEIHKKTVYEISANDDQEAINLAIDGYGSIMEEEYLIDKTSEEIEE
jgi:hypothetical protein